MPIDSFEEDRVECFVVLFDAPETASAAQRAVNLMLENTPSIYV